MIDKETQREILGLTTEIVASYLSNNTADEKIVPGLIEQIYRTLSTLGTGGTPLNAERPAPAVPVKKSVHPDYIICLEDGKKLKMLRRHLKTAYGMTPDGYRERWGLPLDYPMTAPNYAKQRSKLAKDIGLGRKKGARKKTAAQKAA